MSDKECRKKNDSVKRPVVDLSDVVKGMQFAVNEAQQTLEAHNLKSLLHFFYNDGKPKTVDLKLKDGKRLNVPLVALANHESLKIENLSMEFDAQIEQVHINVCDEIPVNLEKSDCLDGKDLDDCAEPNNPAVFDIGFSGQPHSNTIKVKINFSSANHTEGLARILDEYNKLVCPYTLTKRAACRSENERNTGANNSTGTNSNNNSAKDSDLQAVFGQPMSAGSPSLEDTIAEKK